MHVQPTGSDDSTRAPKQALRDLEDGIERFEQDILEGEAFFDQLKLEEQGQLLLDLERLIKQLQFVRSALEPSFVRALGDEEMLALNGGVVKASWSKGRRGWQHQAIQSVMIEKILGSCIDPETGTLAVPVVVVMERLLKAVSVAGYKTTVLKPLGVNVDRYCESDPAKPSVRYSLSRSPGSLVKSKER